jgi:uncharacterized small protein (DUF1192 family)
MYHHHKLLDLNDWHSLQPLGVQFEDYSTCDSDLEVCGIHSANQVLDQRFAIPQVEVAELKATFLDAIQELEAARKYMCQFNTENNITVMCNEAENEIYRLTAQEKKKYKTLTEWLRKRCNYICTIFASLCSQMLA